MNTVLFACVHNAGQSQIAAAILTRLVDRSAARGRSGVVNRPARSGHAAGPIAEGGYGQTQLGDAAMAASVALRHGWLGLAAELSFAHVCSSILESSPQRLH